MSDLRCSDADREEVVAALRHHHEAGRITTDELEERIAAAWDAKLASQLAALTADLPATRTPAPVAPAPRLPRAPGRRPFAARRRIRGSPGRVMAELLADVAPPLQRAGYDLVERTAERAVFARRRTPLWVVPIVVLTFPFGLLALLIRTEDRIAVELVPDGGDTLLYVQGAAPLSVRRAFAELEA
jgi:Domain of unknown function (DUF1707)